MCTFCNLNIIIHVIQHYEIMISIMKIEKIAFMKNYFSFILKSEHNFFHFHSFIKILLVHFTEYVHNSIERLGLLFREHNHKN